MLNVDYFQNKMTPSKLCFLSPYCDVLEGYGIHVKEDYLLGIVKGVMFDYDYLHDNHVIELPVSPTDTISIVGTNSDIYKDIQDLLGVLFYEVSIQSSDEAFSLCIDQINNDKPVIAYFDVYYLPYHPQFQKTHAQTNLLLYGWDENKNQILFYDGHVTTIPISTFVGTLSQSSFCKSLVWGVNRFNGRNIGMVFNDFSHKPIDINLLQIIHDQAVNMLISPKAHIGIQGMLCLTDEMSWWPKFWNPQSILVLWRQAYHHISGRGGPIACRAVYGDFLKNHFNDLKELLELANGFYEVSKKWNALGAKFFRGSIKYDLNILEQIKQLLQDIALMENDLFQLIESYERVCMI